VKVHRIKSIPFFILTKETPREENISGENAIQKNLKENKPSNSAEGRGSKLKKKETRERSGKGEEKRA